MISDLKDVAELQEIADFLEDEDVTRALALILKLSEESPSPQVVVRLITELQAKSFILKMKAKYHMILQSGTDSTKRKNLYFSMSEGIDRVVDSLKYVVKAVS